MEDAETAVEGPFLVSGGSTGNAWFGALMKGLRERSELSRQELADQADVHVSFVRGIERGAQAPSAATARTLLDCFASQGRVEWEAAGSPFDLAILDPNTGRKVGFQFKARVKGQNGLSARPSTKDWLIGPGAGLAAGAAGVAMGGGLGPLVGAAGMLYALRAPAGGADASADARLGRLIRALGQADDQTLQRIETILLTSGKSDADTES